MIYTYRCVKTVRTDCTTTFDQPFLIQLRARSQHEADIRAAALGLALGILLVGPI